MPGGQGFNFPPLGPIINIRIDTPLHAAGQFILHAKQDFQAWAQQDPEFSIFVQGHPGF